MLLGETSQTLVPETQNSTSYLLKAKKLVVDVGFSKDPHTGAIRGDLHQDVYLTPGTVTYLTPVPCGVGPLEMAVLLLRFARSCADHGDETK
jgi:5,10-methylene-tetrahydrofolate dehydrogenase/methenyl tetrahydrofolate cyclohydrolase